LRHSDVGEAFDLIASAWEADRHDTEVVRRNILEIVGELKTAHVRHEADLVRIEALERECNEWDAAARHLLEHYPEDVFPPNSDTPDAKAGTFARRLLTWLLDPVERARFAALAAEEETDGTHD
jgi:hypothetical protein